MGALTVAGVAGHQPDCIPLEVWDAFSSEAPDAASNPPELVQAATMGTVAASLGR